MFKNVLDKIRARKLQKMYDRLEEIPKLFGIEVKVSTNDMIGTCQASIGENKVSMSRYIEEDNEKINGIYNDLLNVIDCFTISISKLMLSFMHEVGHLLTLNESDIDKYWDYYYANGIQYASNSKYCATPYEKLATNLGYQLYVANKTYIDSIILGKNVSITSDIIEKNREIIEELREEYIGHLN